MCVHLSTYCNRICPTSGGFIENRTVTNSNDGCSVSGASITVHLITHPFWSGPSSECGTCHKAFLCAQQLCNHLTSLLPSLSFFKSLYLSLSSAPGWFGRVTWAVSCTQADPDFWSICCVFYETESESAFDKEATGKTQEERKKENSNLIGSMSLPWWHTYMFKILCLHVVDLAT